MVRVCHSAMDMSKRWSHGGSLHSVGNKADTLAVPAVVEGDAECGEAA